MTYTDEQYRRAKDVVETLPKARADIVWQRIQEYEAAKQPRLSDTDVERLRTPPLTQPAENFDTGADFVPPPDTDYNLPNASKKKRFGDKTEYRSKNGSALATIAKSMVVDPLNGPLVTSHFEPSQQQFEADAGPILQAKGIQPGSPEYQEAFDEYKDRKWEQAYKQAEAEDRTLTRVAYVPEDASNWDKLSAYLGESADTASAFTKGFASGRTLGLTKSLETDADREQLTRHPGAAMLGELKGAISPRSLVNKLTGGFGRAATAVGVGRYGAAALAGGAGVAADVASHTAAEALSDKLHGRRPDPDAKSNFTARLLGGAALGAGAGVLGEGVASLAQRYRTAIRQPTSDIGPELTNAEASGTATDAWSGLKPSSDVKAMLERSRGPVPGEAKLPPSGSPVEYAASEVRGPIVAQQELEHVAALKRMEEQSGALYARSPELKQPKQVSALAKAVRQAITERSQPEAVGMFLPTPDQAIAGRNNTPLINFARGVVKPRLVLGVDASKEAARTGGEVVSLEDARRMGFKVKGLETELNPETGIPHNAPSLSDYDTPAAGVGALAAEHPDLPLVQRYINETRMANGIAERAGMPRETSAGMNGFLRDAEAAGHTYKGTVYRGATPSELERILQEGVTPSAWSAAKSVEGAMPFAKKGGVLFEIEGGAVPTDGIPGSNTFEEMLVPHGSPIRVVGRRNEGGIEIVTLRRQGSQPETELSATKPEIDVAPSDIEVPANYPKEEFAVVLDPRAYDALKLEQQIKAIDQAGKAGTEAKVDPVWKDLMRAARVDREQFGKAWSGLKNVHHEELTALEQRGAHAGITERNLYPGMSGNAQKTANAAITNYGVAPQATNEALGELATNAGVRPGLETLKGTRAYSALMEKASPQAGMTEGGGFLRVGGLLPGAKLRLDAAARGLTRGPEGNPLFMQKFDPALANQPLGRELLPSSGLLAVGRGALGVKTGSVYDSATGRSKPAGTLTPQERERLESLLSQ